MWEDVTKELKTGRARMGRNATDDGRTACNGHGKEKMERIGRGTHLAKIDLCVRAHPGLADEIDDPLLALVAREVEALREVTITRA